MRDLPCSSSRQFLLLVRLALRRISNRVRSLLHRKSYSKRVGVGGGKRGATARKSCGAVLCGVLLVPLILFTMMNYWGRAIAGIAEGLDRRSIVSRGLVPLSQSAYSQLVRFKKGASGGNRSLSPVRREELRPSLRQLFSSELRDEGLSSEDVKRKVDAWVEAYERRGLSGFCALRDRRPRAPWPDRRYWAVAENSPLMVRVVGLFLFLFALSALLVELGIRNMDLGRVEWDLAWLFTLPVRARTVFAAKVTTYAISAIFLWMFVAPFLLAAFFSAGYGAWSVPLALGCALCIGFVLASLRVSVEVWLRKHFSRNGIRNFQALASVAGTLVLVVCYLPTGRVAVIDRVAQILSGAPGWAFWQPFSLPAFLCGAGVSRLAVGSAIVAFAVLVPLGVTRFLAERAVRSGLLREPGPYSGVRAVSKTVRRHDKVRSIVAKDARLLLRNRAFFVQTLVLPLMLIGFNFAVNPVLLHSAVSDFDYASALAFGVGAFILLAVPAVIAAEGKSLWLLFTFPQKISRMLTRKAWFWAGVASIYTMAILILSVVRRGWSGQEAALGFALALGGVVIYAWVALGLSVLMSDPLETEAQHRTRPELSMLYLALVGMYGVVMFLPSLHSKIVMVVLSSLLAYSIWEEAKRRMPLLLDPTSLPPHQIGVGDGVIAAYAFFATQGLVLLAFHYKHSVPVARDLVVIYSLAGFLVTITTLYAFKRLRVPDLLRSIGLRRPEGSVRCVRRAVITGVGWGAAAASFGFLYLLGIVLVGPFWGVGRDAMRLFVLGGVGGLWWLLALMLVAAPLFEEYIFRGLLFKALRRTLRPSLAIPASAAIFAMVHSPASALPVFVLGLAAALSFERSGLLVAPIAAHCTYNAGIILAAGLIAWGQL